MQSAWVESAYIRHSVFTLLHTEDSEAVFNTDYTLVLYYTD
jgi:hypothetical protein